VFLSQRVDNTKGQNKPGGTIDGTKAWLKYRYWGKQTEAGGAPEGHDVKTKNHGL
jgi:hypothetical protein